MKKHEYFQIMMVASLVFHTHGFIVSVLSFAVWCVIANYLGKDE